MAAPLLGVAFVGRPVSAFNVMVLVASVITAFDPLVLHDVAFQLSFAATAGIIWLASPIQEIIARLLSRVLPKRAAGFVAESASLTSGASLLALPVIAWHFGRVSLIALPANLFAGFMFPLILLTSFVTAVAGAISTELGRLAGEVAYLPLRYLVLVGRGCRGRCRSVWSRGRQRCWP
jgi:competence protein ComEC